MKYSTTVSAQLAGITGNIGSDGNTYQNVASMCAAMRAVSLVSRQSQITAMIEISGRDATRAPKAGLRLAISATAAAITPDRAALIVRQGIV